MSTQPLQMLPEPVPERREADVDEIARPDEPGTGEPAVAPEQPAPLPPVPMHPARAAIYVGASFLLAITQGFGVNLVTANVPQIQGALSATPIEANWLIAAYMIPNASLSLILIKLRTQYGLRNFAELAILGFVIVSFLNLTVTDLETALVVRFISGIAGTPLSTLGFLYMLEAFPPQKKLTIGLAFALTGISMGMPVARLISPALLDIGGWHGLTVFELGLALLSFCAVYLLPLTPIPRARVISRLDVLSYLLIAVGFGSLAVVLALGRLYWWFEAPWLGAVLALSIAAVTAAAVIEMNRKNPLVDVHWIVSPPVLHFTAALLVFRIVLAEQTTGASGFFQVLGLTNDQTHTLYLVVAASTIFGGLACAAIMKPGREPAIHMVALALLAAGAFMDSHATNLTRPEQMYLSQAMIAVAGALFLPPAVASGLASALKKGPNYILSFVIVFLTTQSLGGLLGSAVLGTFITIREKYHSSILVEHIALTDPLVAQRVSQLSGIYGRVLTDKALLNAEGLSLLGQQATKEANVLAYNDLFLGVAVLAVVALVLLVVHVAIQAARAAAKPSPQTA